MVKSRGGDVGWDLVSDVRIFRLVNLFIVYRTGNTEGRFLVCLHFLASSVLQLEKRSFIGVVQALVGMLAGVANNRPSLPTVLYHSVHSDIVMFSVP